jgi:hypothetical protein
MKRGLKRGLFTVSASGGCLALLLGAATTQGPTFNTKMEMKGSTTFVHANWHIDGTTGSDPEHARARMENGGLTLGLDADEPSTPAIQFRRQFIVGDGVIWAWFRIRINDVDEVGFWLGLYSRDADPEAQEPDRIVALHKPWDETAVDLRTRDATGFHTENNVFTMSDQTSYDLVVKLDPTTASNSATFWWRESGATTWSSQTVTSNVPEDTATLHFSLCAFTENENPPDNRALVAEVFEAEAPKSDTGTSSPPKRSGARTSILLSTSLTAPCASPQRCVRPTRTAAFGSTFSNSKSSVSRHAATR